MGQVRNRVISDFTDTPTTRRHSGAIGAGMQWSSQIQWQKVASRSPESGLSRPLAIIDRSDIIDCMASITVRNLEEKLKHRLKVRAAENGRSMEQEVREILKSALHKASKPKTGADLVKRIRAIWEPLGGVELEVPAREPMRDPDWIKD